KSRSAKIITSWNESICAVDLRSFTGTETVRFRPVDVGGIDSDESVDDRSSLRTPLLTAVATRLDIDVSNSTKNDASMTNASHGPGDLLQVGRASCRQ